MSFLPGIPIPVIELQMWGKAAEQIQWEQRVRVRTGWIGFVTRIDKGHVLLIRPLDRDRDEACLLVEDESSERMT